MTYLIVDCHCDAILDVSKGIRSLAQETKIGHMDFPRMIKGQVILGFMALFIEQSYRPYQTVNRALELIELLKNEVEQTDYISFVLSKKDLELFAPNQGKVLMAIEGGEALRGQIENLQTFYNLGVRSMTLTWNHKNEIATGCSDLSREGLSPFGKEVVEQMNNLGMLIDVSHISERGFWDVLKCSQKPVIASHSCCKSLCSHNRNLSNSQMKALAEQEGVLAINFYPSFLNPSNEATINDVINHITYACEIMGVDYVALGSDFDGIDKVPKGLESIEKMPELIDILEKRGFSSLEIANIMGNNILRLLKKVL